MKLTYSLCAKATLKYTRLRNVDIYIYYLKFGLTLSFIVMEIKLGQS